MVNKRGAIERALGSRSIAGVDEVGRGCIAGPVYAGAAVLDLARLRRLPRKHRDLIRDSKTLSSDQRQRALVIIHDLAHGLATAAADVAEIEALGINQAGFLAMHRALMQIRVAFDILLIDGKGLLPNYAGEQRAIVKGDDLCYSIAAAAIAAKEERDRYMKAMAREFPSYGFDRHVGYATRVHLTELTRLGPCALHRTNFSPCKVAIEAH